MFCEGTGSVDVVLIVLILIVVMLVIMEASVLQVVVSIQFNILYLSRKYTFRHKMVLESGPH